MRKTTLAGAAAAAFAATLAFATPASAAATLDPTTGIGFVGKGDVQTAFAWNNKQLQANASGVTFTFESTDNYTAVCTFVTGEGTRGERTHNVDHKTKTSVSSSIAYDTRVKNQITGFNLNGFGSTTTSGTLPVVDGPCMGNEGHDGTWSSVTHVSSTGANLYVNYLTQSVQLTYTDTTLAPAA